MRAEIKMLHQRLGTTIVYVTHDQIEAMTMADKIIVLDGGHISQVGTPLDLYDNPANKFVATFIGSPSMNILRCVVEDGENLRTSDDQLVKLKTSLNAGSEVDLGIRPEHLKLSATNNGLSATVTLIEPTGADTLVSCEVAGAPLLATISDRVDLKPGDVAFFAIDSGKHLLFDVETGLAI